MKTPWEAFIGWFDQVPQELRKRLAHMFTICTTEDTSRMACSSEASLRWFRNWVITADFPIRVAARMFYIRSVFDMVIVHNRDILDHEYAGPLPDQTNVVPISDRQWEKTLASWGGLRKQELSDMYIHSWTSWMVKLDD